MNIKDAYIHNGLGVLRELQVTAAGMLQLKRAAKDSNDAYVGWEDVYNLTNIKPTNAGTADSVPWTGITGKPDTFPVATHDHDDRYLKLSGGTMTGVIERQYNAASNEPVLKIGSANKDIQIFKVYSNDIATYSDTVSGYGYALQYIGSGSGVSNYLRLIADNSTGTKKTAMSINQSGQVGILADPNTSYALYINGATNINGDITASSFKKSGGTSSQFLKADGSVDSNSYALSTHNHNSLDIVPIMSKTYGGTEFYATASGNWDLASRFFMSVVPEGADKYWRVKYHIKVWVPSSNLMTDSIVEYYGSGITMKAYKIWNTHGPTHATYYHVALWLKSAGLSAGYGHMIGESILYATSYTTAASYRHMTVDLLEYEGCTVNMLDTAVKYTDWTGYSSTNYNSINSYNATSAGLQETGDNDDLSVVQQTYTLLQAGANGIKGYSLIMQDDEDKWQSIHTSAVSTGTTKNVNTAKFRLDSNVYYVNRSSDLAANSYLGTSQARVFSPNIDFRYSLNNVTANGTGLTAYKPIYLVGTLDSEGYFKLDTNYWTQTAPTTADGKIYIKVCEAVCLNYSTNVNGSYTGDFGNFGIYQFRNGRLQKFINYAVNADKLNGFSASDFRNNIIDLRTSPQTFNPTYLKDIVFISEADYTSLVSNGSITKNSITHTYNSSNWYVIPDKVPEYAETAGSVAWSNVTSKPDTATRWPSWSEVTGKPSTFNPSSHTHYATRYQDSRNTAMTPTNAVAVHGLAIDFKTKANGVNAGSGLYCGLVTMDPYSDASGGYPMQMGFNTGADTNNTNELYIRTAKDADNWNEWRTVITSVNIGAQTVSSATTATYASNVGTSADHVTAAQVKALHTWYTTVAGNNASGVIDNWNEIKNFIDGFHETDDLATYLTNTFLAKSGGTMTGQIKWTDSTALPEQTSPQYFVCIDAFNSGGTTKWASKANTLKALTGLTSTAIGDSDEPVYWDGSKFVKAGAYPTKASWNYDDVYLKLSGGTLTGNVIYNSEKVTKYKQVRKKSGGGGWEYSPIQFIGNDDVTFFAFGAYGTNTEFSYTYIGSNSYSAENNLRIYSDKIQWGTKKIWHEGNDGASSGLDADLLDGKHASDFALAENAYGTTGNFVNAIYTSNYVARGDLGLVGFDNTPITVSIYEAASGGNYPSSPTKTITVSDETYGTNFKKGIQTTMHTATAGSKVKVVISSSGNYIKAVGIYVGAGGNTISFTSTVGSTTKSGDFNTHGSWHIFSCMHDTPREVTIELNTTNVNYGIILGGFRTYLTNPTNLRFPGVANSADSVAWSNISGKPSTFPVASHDHDDRYLKLTGGTLTGTLTIGTTNYGTQLEIWRKAANVAASIGFYNGASEKSLLGRIGIAGSGTSTCAKSRPYWQADENTYYQLVHSTANTAVGGISTPVYVDANGQIKAGTALGTASTHAHGDYVTSIGTSGTTLTWAKGGTAQTAITVPYASYAGYLNVANLTTESDISTSGIHAYSGSGSTWAGSITSMAYAAILAFGGPSRGWQLWAQRGTGSLIWRNGTNDQTAWNEERTILDSANYTSYTVKKDGTGASGTWGISITGSAGSVAWANVSDRPDFTTWSETSSTATYSLSNATWTQTITLPTAAGSYILKLVSGNSTLTGVFSIGASDNAKDEISLHLHGNGPRLYARTNGTKLELSRNIATATNTSVTITYRRMI